MGLLSAIATALQRLTSTELLVSFIVKNNTRNCGLHKCTFDYLLSRLVKLKDFVIIVYIADRNFMQQIKINYWIPTQLICRQYFSN